MKRKQLSTFQYYLKLDRVIYPCIWCLVALMTVGKDEIKGEQIAFIIIGIFILWYGIYTIRHRRCGYLEKEYKGTFDNLVKKMYEAGVELQSKAGDRYIFSTKYIFLPRQRFVVRTSKKGCKVFGMEYQLRFLSETGIKFNTNNVTNSRDR